jgi:DNA polymerase III sliding clamp (beta) subunit (PCNA family)
MKTGKKHERAPFLMIDKKDFQTFSKSNNNSTISLRTPDLNSAYRMLVPSTSKQSDEEGAPTEWRSDY